MRCVNCGGEPATYTENTKRYWRSYEADDETGKIVIAVPVRWPARSEHVEPVLAVLAIDELVFCSTGCEAAYLEQRAWDVIGGHPGVCAHCAGGFDPDLPFTEPDADGRVFHVGCD